MTPVRNLRRIERDCFKLVRGPHPGIALNEHYAGDDDIV
jgi:hypothetical protein